MSSSAEAALRRIRPGFAAAATTLIACAGLFAAPAATPITRQPAGAVNGTRGQSTCRHWRTTDSSKPRAEWVRNGGSPRKHQRPKFDLQWNRSRHTGAAEGSIASGDPPADATNA